MSIVLRRLFAGRIEELSKFVGDQFGDLPRPQQRTTKRWVKTKVDGMIDWHRWSEQALAPKRGRKPKGTANGVAPEPAFQIDQQLTLPQTGGIPLEEVRQPEGKRG